MRARSLRLTRHAAVEVVEQLVVLQLLTDDEAQGGKPASDSTPESISRAQKAREGWTCAWPEGACQALAVLPGDANSHGNAAVGDLALPPAADVRDGGLQVRKDTQKAWVG